MKIEEPLSIGLAGAGPEESLTPHMYAAYIAELMKKNKAFARPETQVHYSFENLPRSIEEIEALLKAFEKWDHTLTQTQLSILQQPLVRTFADQTSLLALPFVEKGVHHNAVQEFALMPGVQVEIVALVELRRVLRGQTQLFGVMSLGGNNFNALSEHSYRMPHKKEHTDAIQNSFAFVFLQGESA